MVASVILLLLHIVFASKSIRKWLGKASDEEPVQQTSASPTTLVAELKQHVKEHGGPVIYAFMLARLLGSLALLGLSIFSLVIDEVKKLNIQIEEDVSVAGKWSKKHPKRRYGTHFSKREWLEAAVCLTFVSH